MKDAREAGGLSRLSAKRDHILDLEVDRVPDPNRVTQTALAHIDRCTRNTEILTYYERAQNVGAYQADAYVLKNVQEFFAVTASLYLWGNVDRPPRTRANLKAAQPVYYAWLGQQFGVVK